MFGEFKFLLVSDERVNIKKNHKIQIIGLSEFDWLFNFLKIMKPEDAAERIRKTKLVFDYSKIIGDTYVANRHTFFQRMQDLGDMGLKFISIDIHSEEVVGIAVDAVKAAGKMIFIGVSGICTQEQFDLVKDTGIHFVSCPILPPFDLVTMAHELGIVCILSGVTPKDVIAAHDAGADYVQIIPVTSYDISTLKRMIEEGIWQDTKVIGAGGISLETAQYWLNAGCTLVTLSDCLMGKDISLKATDKMYADAVQDFNQHIRSAAFEVLNNVVVCSRPPKKYVWEPKIWDEPWKPVERVTAPPGGVDHWQLG